MLLIFTGSAGYFADDGIDYAKTQFSEKRPSVVDETPIRQNVVPVTSQQAQRISCPDVQMSCPKCPDVKLSCPTGVIERHEKEFHAEK